MEKTLKNEPMAQKRCGYVALLGAPNAGKSTLLNAILGQKIAIVTPKAQTTRSRMLGIAVEGDAQIVFMDVPGVFKAKRGFEKAMVNTAWSSLDDADVILWLHDSTRKPNDETQMMLERVKQSGKKLALVLNKTDLIEDKRRLLPLTEWFTNQLPVDDIFMISALNDDGVQALVRFLCKQMPAMGWLYPEDQLTDAPMRFIAAELTREQCFLQLRDELPYALYVETESYEQKPDGSVKINQVVVVENERQKKIVLGKQGQMLKQIGAKARAQIGDALGTKVHLFLFVKAREGWKDDQHIRATLGLR